MNAFYFGQSLAPCAVGILLALGFIKWKWKVKLIGRIKLLIFIISIIISPIILENVNTTQSFFVVIPLTITFIITLIFGFYLRKKETDLTKLDNEGVDNEQT